MPGEINKRWGFLFICLLLVLPSLSFAQETERNEVNVYFFFGEGCPHCAKEEIFLEELEREYPYLAVRRYETWYDADNAKYFEQVAGWYGFAPKGVPTTFIGDDYWIGFRKNDEKLKDEIRNKIEYCSENECIDFEKAQEGDMEGGCGCQPDEVVTLPLFGEVRAAEVSLPVFTTMLGLVDGFNPCAMWVLTFLLALLVYTKDRKKMLTVGGIFILTSGLVYFLFITAWFNAFRYIQFFAPLRYLVGGFAVVAGLIHTKDFFAFGKGVSLSIPAGVKPKLVRMMSALKKDAALPATLAGVAVLAITVNVVELLCSAGLPVVYTNVLLMHDLPPLTYYLYFVQYIVFYMLDDLAIFLIAVKTMSMKPLQKKGGRALKLISGLLMLLLGLALIFNPALLMFG